MFPESDGLLFCGLQQCCCCCADRSATSQQNILAKFSLSLIIIFVAEEGGHGVQMKELTLSLSLFHSLSLHWASTQC